MTLHCTTISKITKGELDSKLKRESQTGRLEGGEHCFREAINWYRLNVGYTNPINFGEVHAELDLIKSQMHEGVNNPIRQALKGKQQIFYGIGVGDTEIAFVDWAIKEGEDNVYIIGIDVNKDFIENFEVALQNRTFEPDQPNLTFKGYHALFEQITQEDLGLPRYANAHICIGGTIGNFHDQDRIIKQFAQLAKPGDTLVLGVQLDANIDYLFQKYQNNPLFVEFILNYVPNDEREKLEWILDRERGVITAKHKGIESFRTTKYNTEKLQHLATKHGFKFVYQAIDKHKNSCLQVYEKDQKRPNILTRDYNKQKTE